MSWVKAEEEAAVPSGADLYPSLSVDVDHRSAFHVDIEVVRECSLALSLEKEKRRGHSLGEGKEVQVGVASDICS